MSTAPTTLAGVRASRGLSERVKAAASTATPDVRAVLADKHEREKIGDHRVWLGLDDYDRRGWRTDLRWQPQQRRPQCDEHGQDLCSQCPHGGWRQASRRMPLTAPTEDTAIANLCARPDPRIASVEAVLAELPDSDVQLAWMMAAGLDGREAAEMLGITHDATRKRWERLRNRIKACHTFGHLSRGVYAEPVAA